ncbi:MAG: enoyl-CoA hydratase/isomerase family protein [Pseudomonadaceae bacterium]|nr:enoyl-CoA hydratase/isomerase family protein [Pseudomonadaceae bacterium]
MSSSSHPNQYDDICVTVDDYVATVEIQRPPHNFFDYSLISQIAGAFDELDEMSDCRAIVLASSGKSFCAGANFGAGSDDASASDEFTEEGFQNTTGKLYSEALRLFRCRKPIVGAIQGAAIGGGLGLSLVPDFRVAAPEARFSANFTKLGLHPGFGISVTLPRLIGEQAASLMLLTGRRVKAEEALATGLVDILSSTEDLRADAVKLAREIAGNAPLAVVSVRSTLRRGLADEVAAMTKHELAEQQWLRRTSDAEEGIRSVAERRPGQFSGS